MLQQHVREALDAVMASIDALAAVVARQDEGLLDDREAVGRWLAGHKGSPARARQLESASSRAVRGAISGLKALDIVATASQARQVELLVEAAGRAPETLTAKLPDDVQRDTRIGDVRALELAAAMNCTPNRARNLVAEARTLYGELPALLQGVRDGRVTPYQSRIAVEAWTDLCGRFAEAGQTVDELVAGKFQARLLARADSQTAADFRRTAKAAVALLASATHASVMEGARNERMVMMEPAASGMAYVTALLDVAQATRVMQVLSHCARTDTSLKGTQSQRMADALVAIVGGTSEVSGAARSNAAEIQVLVSLETMSRFAAAVAEGRAPDCALAGQIAGSDVMVEGQALLNLMGDARFRRLVVDGQTGQLLDYGRDTYRPPTNLRDHVRGRDRTCRAPGCVRPVRYADVDHVVPWESGGVTSDGNLASLCRTHHVLKTHGGWRYTNSPHHGATWLTPNGVVVTKPPGCYSELLPVDDDAPPF